MHPFKPPNPTDCHFYYSGSCLYVLGRMPMLLVRLSVYSNACKLLSTKTSSGTLNCINGIRFFSMTWVILGHTFAFITTFLSK